jgi:two-component sensor histidine kinase
VPIESFSGVQNDPDHLRCLTNKLELAHSLASIADADTKDSAAHKAAGEGETRLIALEAKNKLIARGVDATKLAKKEINAVLAVYYGKQETVKKNKPILAELLKVEIELNEHILHAI